MHRSVPIAEALADCLDAADTSADDLAASLERYPQYRGELEPLLELAVRASVVATEVGPSTQTGNDPMTIGCLAGVATARPRKGTLTPNELPPRLLSTMSRSIHAVARGHPLLTWITLCAVFLSLAFLAWVPAVGSTLLIYTLSPLIGTLLLVLSFTLLPWFLIRTVIRSATRWLRSLVFSPSLPPRSAASGANVEGTYRVIQGFKAGWASTDAAVRLWYRMVAWSALRVVAFITVYVWAVPAWR